MANKTIYDFIGSIIHCSTRREYEEITKLVSTLDPYYSNTETPWREYHETVCISIESARSANYGSKTWFQKNYPEKILEAKDVLDQINNTTNMSKKLIGYKLLKDSPAAKAGSIYNRKSTQGWYCDKTRRSNSNSWISDINVTDTEWFEPVYEEEIIVKVIQIGDPAITITIRTDIKGYILVDKGTRLQIPITDIKILLDYLMNLSMPSVSKFSTRVEGVWIGCSEGVKVKQEDLELILKTYNQVHAKDTKTDDYSKHPFMGFAE